MINGFSILADSYKRMIEDDANATEQEQETIRKQIRIYEFLATCDTDDFCTLVDSSAFNSIFKAYIKTALVNANVDDNTQRQVLQEINRTLDEVQAIDVLKEQYAKNK